jgi:serine/threonine-protein kinase
MIFKNYKFIEQIDSNHQRDIQLAVTESGPVILKITAAESPVNLLREGRIISNLQHDAFCTVGEVGSFDQKNFIAMEYIEGISLEKVLEDLVSQQKPNIGISLIIGCQIASALEHLQTPRKFPGTGTGIVVHGDLSPKNLLITRTGELKLIDFGSARIVKEKESQKVDVATVRYASPARLLEKQLDLHDDLFALGVILWELCTGWRYWQNLGNDEIVAEMKQFAAKDPAAFNPSLPAPIAKIVLACLETDYFSGYIGAADVLSDLDAVRRELAGNTNQLDLAAYVNERFPEMEKVFQARREQFALAQYELKALESAPTEPPPLPKKK